MLSASLSPSTRSRGVELPHRGSEAGQIHALEPCETVEVAGRAGRAVLACGEPTDQQVIDLVTSEGFDNSIWIERWPVWLNGRVRHRQPRVEYGVARHVEARRGTLAPSPRCRGGARPAGSSHRPALAEADRAEHPRTVRVPYHLSHASIVRPTHPRTASSPRQYVRLLRRSGRLSRPSAGG